MAGVELVIVNDQRIIGVVQNYAGPVPREGEWLAVPSEGLAKTPLVVRDVSYKILELRPGNKRFTGRAPETYQVVIAVE